ncbi:MAG TPA: terminase family protein [Methanothrix sp.]|nr:terminase family protein [Methanothrix sp.]
MTDSSGVFTVDLYRPLPAFASFHHDRNKWRVLIGSNRSGKTLAAAVELARAVTNRDPYHKYRPTNGVAVVIGLDYNHIGMLWRKLYLPGAIKLIRTSNKSYRAVRFYTDENDGQAHCDRTDLNCRSSWIDAPPLIPPEQIDRCSWHDRSQYIPAVVCLLNGWRIMFFSSRGQVKQGEHYDLVWIDEQIGNNSFYYEAVRGLVDVDNFRSYGIWSATGQKQNPLLWELTQKAKNNKEVKVYFNDIANNPFITKEERDFFAALLPEDEKRVRVDGEMAIEAWRIYSEFDYANHVCTPFIIPDNWTRYLAMDPGTLHCATVFAAVDPTNNLYIYDIADVQGGGAVAWAKMMEQRADSRMFEAWIIDKRAGRVRSISNQESVANRYFAAAMERDIRPRTIGTLDGFVPGCDEPSVRREVLKEYLLSSAGLHDGPKIKIFDYCGRLIHQIKTAQYDAKNPSRRIKGQFDFLDALEYLVAYRPKAIVRPQPFGNTSKTIHEIIYERNRMFRTARQAGARGISFG